MEIGIILHQMLQFFIIMFLGYFLSKVKLVDHDFIKKLTKLLLNVTLPATIFLRYWRRILNAIREA